MKNAPDFVIYFASHLWPRLRKKGKKAIKHHDWFLFLNICSPIFVLAVNIYKIWIFKLNPLHQSVADNFSNLAHPPKMALNMACLILPPKIKHQPKILEKLLLNFQTLPPEDKILNLKDVRLLAQIEKLQRHPIHQTEKLMSLAYLALNRITFLKKNLEKVIFQALVFIDPEWLEIISQ